MIKVNDHWESINDFQDVSRIIREYYNPDLADELDSLINEIEVSSDDDIKRLEELENIIEEIRMLVG